MFKTKHNHQLISNGQFEEMLEGKHNMFYALSTAQNVFQQVKDDI